ncbi:MAG: hypothetical protein M1827_003505 [Pycnora praestabilis]|nr:MAG: hypothetical protein M1827_003505 [Pycnora praestabilis]
MSSKLPAEVVKDLKQKIDAATADPTTGIPGVVYRVIGKDGQPLLEHASGKRGANSTEPMTLETVFWIASCTKMVVGIACMQLVEQGKLALDDVDMVERLAPELKEVKVLQERDGKGELVPKKKGITLRMLLSHTAGFGYTFFDEKLNNWSKPIGFDEFSGHAEDIMSQPLVNQPGEQWEYGINIDWAGVLLERVTGLRLNDYLQKNVCGPLGLESTNMFPNKAMKEKLATMHHRDANGKISEVDHLQRRPLLAEVDVENTFNSGGAGFFSQPKEYCEILAVLLNNGKHPTKDVRLLESSTIDEMFKNQIPEHPNFGRQLVADAKPYLTNKIPELYPQPKEQEQGWGLTFMLMPHAGGTGRGGGTGWWAGLANLFWWADRDRGVAGMIATQILPFADPKVMGLWAEVEAGVYAALDK